MGASGVPLYGGAEKSGALDVEPEELRPGLLAHYRSLADPDATLYRLEAKPAFYLGHSSPHPRIPPGPFEVVWTGVRNLTDPAPLTFDAFVCGEVTVEDDGVRVLDGHGDSTTAQIKSKEPLQRPQGLYRLKIRYRSATNKPARLQIGWQGRTFSREPLPAWQHRGRRRGGHATGARGRLDKADHPRPPGGQPVAGRVGCTGIWAKPGRTDRCGSSNRSGGSDVWNR